MGRPKKVITFDFSGLTATEMLDALRENNLTQSELLVNLQKVTLAYNRMKDDVQSQLNVIKLKSIALVKALENF